MLYRICCSPPPPPPSFISSHWRHFITFTAVVFITPLLCCGDTKACLIVLLIILISFLRLWPLLGESGLIYWPSYDDAIAVSRPATSSSPACFRCMSEGPLNRQALSCNIKPPSPNVFGRRESLAPNKLPISLRQLVRKLHLSL